MSGDDKRKHLDFIQLTITRLAANSFLLKGWTITIIVALFALAGEQNRQASMLLAFMPLIAFWILDGFYLSQERMFRELYKDVAAGNNDEIDYSMSTEKYKGGRNGWLRAIFSKTLIIFYGVVLMTLIITLVGPHIHITGQISWR